MGGRASGGGVVGGLAASFLCQNRERTGVPARAARVGWWLRPDQTTNIRVEDASSFHVAWLIRSLPLAVSDTGRRLCYILGVK